MKQSEKNKEKKSTVSDEMQENKCKDNQESCTCCEQDVENSCECEENTEEGNENSLEGFEKMKIKLEKKNKEAEENYNKFLRMQADFENYKRRIAKEKEEIFKISLESIVKDLLPVIDNLDRAVESFRNDDLDSKYVEGVDMVCKQFIGVLEKNDVKEIEALNSEFDPNVHHAVMQVEGDGEDDNKVKEVLQKGYTLGKRVVRPAMVKVVVNN